ncbi:dimethylsulfonioproprionate lyase family protein [Pararhodospirillum photometricum]|uniref:Dimethlysulfonioproprionate lyase n=1 Tax=Pararhodospirillum photometricum DSM 122 TaxID=1150469 RepID=H6SKV8_PARPM|nr:dimethylsulfonioproprionate lyase family protein [Pararhodospirillum photometricum]CCG08623.1 Putative uncharacterized protein [Pararhodospirillum photometricum DSM 122]
MTPRDAVLLRQLLALLWRHLRAGRGRGDAVAAEIQRIEAGLDHVGNSPRPWPQSPSPLGPILDAALADVGDPDLAGVLRIIGPHLPWRYGYAPRSDAPGLENRMGWAELVGPEAPFLSSSICLGLTVIGPNTHYLPHRHPAVEVYLVLAGHALWWGEGLTTEPPPGAFILHPSQAVHAMRTGTEPLLALYTWSGDIQSPSVWAESPA